MQMKQILALAVSIASAEAAYKGFNYGSTNEDGSTRYKADFVSQFQNAKNLVGTSGFTSARLYTMIQEGTTNTPIEAIEAAIEEETSLLLGLWTSGGNIDNEITALKSAINTYGTSFTKLVVGISVGSEDLYRNSVTGAKSDAGVGMNPDDLVKCIESVKTAISGTTLSSATIGHVDTWDAWTNTSNSAVISEIDWLGFDTYPYYQTTDENDIDNAQALFDEAVAKTKAVADGKEIWVTETGWPVSGDSENEGVPSVANAKKYWDTVGCSLFGTTNTWWYIQQDYGASPSFGIVGETLSTTPLFDLTCPNSTTTSTSTSATASSTGKASGKSSTGSSVGSSSGAKVSGFSAGRKGNGTAAASGFRSVTASVPLATASGSSSTASGSSSSGSGSSSSGSSSGSGSSGSSSGSSSSSSASASSTAYTGAATRPAGSIFGAVVAALALAIAV